MTLAAPDNSERWATAYEAGHAVVAWAHGLTINEVSINPSAEIAGFCASQKALEGVRPDNDYCDEHRAKARVDMLVSLAGALAQQRHDASSYEGFHAASDHAHAIGLASYYCEGSDERLQAIIADAEADAAQLVDQHWAAIQRLAEALYEQTTLTKEGIAAVLTPI